MTHRNKWWTLVTVCVATFMLLLDVTIVNVALRTIQDDLNSSFSDLQWVVDAYALTLASFLLVSGSLADIFGRKRVFMIGIVIFTVGSALCGLANDPLALNLSRAFQGVGAAAMFATALALLAQEFRGRERGTAFGIWGAITGAAVAIGPLIGGVLTDNFGWESIFLVNIPVGIIAVAFTLLYVSDTHKTHRVRVDWAGFVTFSLALFCLIYALVRGGAEGWSSGMIVGAFVASAVLFIAFVLAEWKQASPMLDLRLFKKPAFIGASVAAWALSASIFSLFLYITLYFQNILLYSPTETGVRFLPNSILSFVIAALAGKASAHLPIRGLMSVGLFLIAVGLFLMGYLVNAESSYSAILVGLCITGFGVGMTNPPLASAAIAVVPPRQSGMASGISSTFRQVGIATGIAGLGAVFQHVINGDVESRLSSHIGAEGAAKVAEGVTNGQVGAAIQEHPEQAMVIADAVRASFIHGFNDIAYVAAGVAFLGAVVVAATVRTKDLHHGAP